MNLEHVKVGSPLSVDVRSGGRLLVAKGTVDRKVLRALRGKVDLARMLVDDYRTGKNPFRD